MLQCDMDNIVERVSWLPVLRNLHRSLRPTTASTPCRMHKPEKACLPLPITFSKRPPQSSNVELSLTHTVAQIHASLQTPPFHPPHSRKYLHSSQYPYLLAPSLRPRHRLSYTVRYAFSGSLAFRLRWCDGPGRWLDR